MRTRFFAIGMLLLLAVLGACNSGSVLLTQATGFAYEIVVVMDQRQWEGAAGQALKAELTSDVPGLPQSEPSLQVTYVQPDVFSGMLRYVRNVLIVKIDPAIYTKASLSYEHNVWANNQVVMTLNAPDTTSIIEHVKEHPTVVVDFFVKAELDRAQSQLKEEYSSVVMDTLRGMMDVELNAPAKLTYYKCGKDFFWASNNANTGRMDLIVYTFPYTDPNTFTSEYLVAKRDSVLKENLPGSFPGSYMQTESRAGVSYTPITLNDKYCGVMRGLWRVEGDMMGGPFVSHTRLDEKNNRVVVAEGFVYAPETDKRNYIRRMEAALYTLRLPGEFGQATDGKSDVPEDKK